VLASEQDSFSILVHASELGRGGPWRVIDRRRVVPWGCGKGELGDCGGGKRDARRPSAYDPSVGLPQSVVCRAEIERERRRNACEEKMR